jgi:hypothetical protein
MPSKTRTDPTPSAVVDEDGTERPTRTVAEDNEIALNGAPAKVFTFPAVTPDADGYYHAARWIKVVCDWDGLAPREGAEPLWAEIDASLTFNEARRIPNPFETPYAELAKHVGPRVRAWNARMVDAETGNLVPAPPPSEKGMDAFWDVNVYILVWLAFTLRTLHLQGGPNRKNATTPSGAGSDGPSDGG